MNVGSFLVFATLGAVLTTVGIGIVVTIGDAIRHRAGSQKKRKISFATRKKCKQLRRAGEDSRAALRKFHDTKQAARIEARQSWQARYDELVPVPVHVRAVDRMVHRRAMVPDDGWIEYAPTYTNNELRIKINEMLATPVTYHYQEEDY